MKKWIKCRGVKRIRGERKKVDKNGVNAKRMEGMVGRCDSLTGTDESEKREKKK